MPTQQFRDSLGDYKDANSLFEKRLHDQFNFFEKEKIDNNQKMCLSLLEENGTPADFSLWYCLTETINQVERVIKEKPSREISIVKTKLEEAIMWLKSVK